MSLSQVPTAHEVEGVAASAAPPPVTAGAAFRVGRRASSPPQLGQTPCTSRAHAAQNVHS
ncbi:MAG TPA: hypothetical protein VF591_22135 [Pyrinomonadaceae bacterium]